MASRDGTTASDRDSGDASPGDLRARDEPEVQKIWLSLQAQEWRSLALVPASSKVDVLPLAHAFSAAGLRHRGESIGVADLREISTANVDKHIEVVRWHIGRGERVIIALKSFAESPATLPLVRVADAVVLCVTLGKTRRAEANATIGQVGRDRFIGTVLVRPAPVAAPEPNASPPPRLKA